jgi:hypothetical protein
MDKFKRLNRAGGYSIMTELVSRAIHVYMHKDCKGPFQVFKIDPKKTMKIMFDKLTKVYAKEDGIVHFFFLNSRFLESETLEEVRMEEGACIKYFNFLSFFLDRKLAEMDNCNI